MLSGSSEEREIARRAMRVAMTITELPLMAIVGYLIGRRLGRELEGALLGLLIGLILIIASVWPVIKSRR